MIKPRLRLIPITIGMRHAIHDRVIGFPQVNAGASRFRLHDCNIETTALEIAPYLRAQLFLCRAVNLDDIIALIDQGLGYQFIIRTEGSEHDDGLAQRCHQFNRLPKLTVANVMEPVLLIISEASGDLSALRYVRYR